MRPIAVISGDIHYNLQNLEVADKATRMAINKANGLNIPFIANGDVTDNKAILRAECVNAMIETLKTAKIKPFINIGNHDKIHNKDSRHALEFLRPYATVISVPTYFTELGAYIIPYHDSVDELRQFLLSILPQQILIMHQGLNGSNMGHYVQDSSALNPEDLAEFRTILSHYHARQDIECGDNMASYIGSPFTTSFGEANDLEKGYQILYNDGSLEFVPTNLRKHRIITVGWGTKDTVFREEFFWGPIIKIDETDILWIKVEGPSDKLAIVSKEWLRKQFSIPVADFRLDLISTETKSIGKTDNNAPQTEVLDSIIENLTNTDDDRKSRLKQLWRQLV